MFGIWHFRPLRLGQYWHVLVTDFETSTDAFYRSIRESVESQQLPDIQVSELEFSEGALFSSRRRYLRIRRERLIFDICSAPFGTSWFFSCRFGEIPANLRWWEYLVILGAAYALFLAHESVFGLYWGVAILILNLGAFVFLLNILVATGLYGLDAALLRVPVVGALYERFLRGGSYFRTDTRRMFQRAVDQVVREAVEEFAGKKAGREIQFVEELAPTGLGFVGRVLDAVRVPWLKPHRNPPRP